jgi:hypothetical protein
MPLLDFKPVGRSSLDMSDCDSALDVWNCAVKRRVGAWKKLRGVGLSWDECFAIVKVRSSDMEANLNASIEGAYMAELSAAARLSNRDVGLTHAVALRGKPLSSGRNDAWFSIICIAKHRA